MAKQMLESYILSYLLNSLWLVPLMWAAGWIAEQILRPAGRSFEHRVWVITLGLQSLLPTCSLLPWAWSRALLFWIASSREPRNAHVSVLWTEGTAAGVLPWASGVWHAVSILYVAVCTYLVARFLWRGWIVHTLRQSAVPLMLDPEGTSSWDQCCRKFGVQGAAMVTSSRIVGPVTLGFRRKLVLLPTEMDLTLCPADLRTVIAHECAHMSRHDFVKNLVYELLALPVAYHPFFWPVRERIVQTREMVCDELAARLTGHHAYAHSLLRLASLLVSSTPVRTPHAIGIFDAHTFERRLMNLINTHEEVTGLRRAGYLAACAALAFGTCSVALALGVHVSPSWTLAASPAKQPESLSIPANVMAGNLLTKAVPVYPPEAKKAKIEGTVVLRAVIGKGGKVENLQVVSGPKELQQSSLDAVRQWTYKPYLLNGDPIEVKTTVHIVYSLAG